jgi:hypothetical protein
VPENVCIDYPLKKQENRPWEALTRTNFLLTVSKKRAYQKIEFLG